MTSKLLFVIKNKRPNFEGNIDEGLALRYNFFIESTRYILCSALSDSTKSNPLRDNTINVLLKGINRGVIMLGNWFYGKTKSLISYFEGSCKSFVVYEANVNEFDDHEYQSLLFDIERWTQKTAVTYGLYFINEAYFSLKCLSRQFKGLGLKIPRRLKEMDKVLTYCLNYLDRKASLAPINLSLPKKFSSSTPANVLSEENTIKISIVNCGASGINGTCGIKRDEVITHTSLQKGQIKVSESDNEYVLGADLLLKIYNEFNGELWEDVKLARFLSVFSNNATTALTIRDGKKELFYGLLRRMYNYKQDNIINQYDWIKPVIENHNLSMSGYTNVLNKLFNARQKSKPQRTFIAKLNKIMPLIDNPPH